MHMRLFEMDFDCLCLEFKNFFFEQNQECLDYIENEEREDSE